MDKSLPKIFRLALNIWWFLVYTFVFSIIFSFLFPIILKLLWKQILNPADPIFAKIQLVIAIIVLGITLYFRKYCYMSLSDDNEQYTKVEKLNIKNKRKDDTKDDTKDDFKFFVEQENDDEDELKIYVDKEIKR